MQPKVIVLGSLNTDIIGLGVDHLLGKGELTLSGELKIGPGGKSRNIAQMIATLDSQIGVSMIGVTSEDPFGLWKVPFDPLKNSGVDVSNVKIFDYEKTGKFPGVALIPVDREGQNQIYVLPGISNEFSPQIIKDSEEIFGKAQIVVFTLEMPEDTILEALKLSKKYGLEVYFDPGGIGENFNIEILNAGISVIKPNEFEAEILTGIKVTDLSSAADAARKLMNFGIDTVLITHGEKGAYLFTQEISLHIPTPEIDIDKTKRDATGAGDQTLAGLIYSRLKGNGVEDSAKIAVQAGTLQYFREGVDPIKADDLFMN